MHEAMVAAFERMGAPSLLTMDLPSYKALTCEFLSSLSTTVTTTSQGGMISFRLGNENREVSLSDWNDLLGFTTFFEHRRSIHLFPLKTTFWQRISGTTDYPLHPMLSHIASPLFRYILRVLGHTVFARKEKSKPTSREMLLLYHCLHEFPVGSFPTKYEDNVGYELLQHLKASKLDKGDLWVGGMIAQVDAYFQVDFSRYTPKTPLRINVEYLQAARIIAYNPTRKLYVSHFGDFEGVLIARKMDVTTWSSWYRAWSGKELPAVFLRGAHEEKPKPLLAGNVEVASESEEESDDEVDMDEEVPSDETGDVGMEEVAPSVDYTRMCADLKSLTTRFGEHVQTWDNRWKVQEAFHTDSRAFYADFRAYYALDPRWAPTSSSQQPIPPLAAS